MPMNEEPKSLERWHFELKSIGKKHWVTFYESFLGVSPSNIPRLFKTLSLYGYWPLFEAIVESADKPLEGDKLNYVVVVAKNKFKEQQEELDNTDEYAQSIEESKESTRSANQVLERKIKGRNKCRSKPLPKQP
jgi:hypothetical protein